MFKNNKKINRQLVSLKPITEEDFDAVANLGKYIWESHYSNIISMAQIAYMLKGRYTPDNLKIYINAADRWFQILKLEEKPIGYCSYSLTNKASEMKLEQLYLLPELHGNGLGGLMLKHIEGFAQNKGCNTLMLTVNKNNLSSIAIYKKSGFNVREEAVFDIGNGFVMDDYIMEKQLS